MHELSIAQAILDRVETEAARHPQAKPVRVGVRIGEISGVDCDSLAFGFECLVKDTAFEPLALDIAYVARRQRCSKCAHEFDAPNCETVCPQCGAFDTICIAGEELDIAFIEVEEA